MNGLLSRVEILIAGVLLLIFFLWSGSKCKETKVQLQQEAQLTAVADSLEKDKVATIESANEPKDPLAVALEKKQAERMAKAAAQAKADSIKNAKDIANGLVATVIATNDGKPVAASSKLFITIDKLKIRSSPGLKSKVLGELPLFSEVFFMDEVTDSLYTVSLGKETATEPYVKVKTKRGTIGWVYGAGVNYYKKKRTGVLE